MKKLIFNKFYKDTLKFFFASLLIIGTIVWTIQAVNYFDFVTEDGHGLKIYFFYSILNFPKIIHRLIPFIFLISLFYIIISYENRNELNIFWINGIHKIKLLNRIIVLSIFITFIQIILATIIAPKTQLQARNFLKDSDSNFFTSLIKPGKFLNSVKDLTIFIEKKDENQNFYNIFIEDNRKQSRIIYAKKGKLILNEETKKFELLNGEIVDESKSKLNVFGYDKIDLNLLNINSNTITVPKIQEVNTFFLINCLLNKNNSFKNFKCQKSIKPEIKSELYKRIIKPFYNLALAVFAGFLLLFSKQKKKFIFYRNTLFLICFFILIFSETSARYISLADANHIFLITTPIITLIFSYFVFLRLSKNV